jgi:hypothetical protein
MKTIQDGKRCENCTEINGCGSLQTALVFSRTLDKVMAVCDFCAENILEERFPEYTEWCPNCGCGCPVN